MAVYLGELREIPWHFSNEAVADYGNLRLIEIFTLEVMKRIRKYK